MPVYTVSQVVRYLKGALEGDSLLRDLWVSGEVSNLSFSAAGHCYFTLTEGGCQIRCVLFRGREGAEHLADGVAVVAHGSVSLYEVRGDLHLYVDLVRPEGVGELYLELERRKARLRAEGLFAEARKRPLPPFPRRIGVITSPFGAVWHDIQSVIRRRYPLVELVLAPCQVQGDGAAESIVEAFQALNAQEGIDLVILARGGGSLEELWPFNEEAVARAIASSRAPVLSAVGHETDWTIADLVADRRAPTPSAAAEMAVPDGRDLLSRVAGLRERVEGFARRALGERRGRVETLTHRLGLQAPSLPSARQRVDDLAGRAGRTVARFLEVRRERVRGLRDRLAALDPRAVLGRGYALLRRGDTGAPVSSVAQVGPGLLLRVSVRDGAFRAEVLDREGSGGHV